MLSSYKIKNFHPRTKVSWYHLSLHTNVCLNLLTPATSFSNNSKKKLQVHLPISIETNFHQPFALYFPYKMVLFFSTLVYYTINCFLLSTLICVFCQNPYQLDPFFWTMSYPQFTILFCWSMIITTTRYQ